MYIHIYIYIAVARRASRYHRLKSEPISKHMRLRRIIGTFTLNKIQSSAKINDDESTTSTNKAHLWVERLCDELFNKPWCGALPQV